MKRFISVVWMFILFAVVSCQREKEETADAVSFVSVPVSLGTDSGDGTRSVVSIDVESFRKASLFAFYSKTGSYKPGEIATYGSEAGNMQGQPVAIETTQKNFNWALPQDKDLDIYVIVNYGSGTLNTQLQSYRSNSTLTESVLDGLKFYSADVSDLKKLETTNAGLPMASIVNTRINSSSDVLNIRVKRLFAKYNIYFNIDELRAHSFQADAIYLKVMNANTEVPFFQENFKQTDPEKLVEYDYATSEDLSKIDAGGSGNAISFYVLENCQSDDTYESVSSCGGWTKIEDLSSVSKCTYIDIKVRGCKYNNIVTHDLCYKLYLSNVDWKTLDVKRNVNTTYELALPWVLQENPQFDDPVLPAKYFMFKDLDEVTFYPGETKTISYATNLITNWLGFTTYNRGTETPVNNVLTTGNFNRNDVVVTASSSAVPGRTYDFVGGALTRGITSTLGVRIVEDPNIWININLTYDWNNYEYVFTADRALPCRVDFKWYNGQTSPSQGYIPANSTMMNYAMPPSHDLVEWIELWKLNGHECPPYTYESGGKTYHFVFSVEGNNFEEPE
jgi:hypothetical protein